MEHVITGGLARTMYYCGGCDYDWTISDSKPSPAAVPPKVKPKAQRAGSKR